MKYVSPGSGKLAVTLACEHGHVETVDAFLPFLDLDAMHRGLSWAAQFGQAAVVRLILSQPGVEVDAVVRGSTALFKACLKRDLATVKVLLGAGADPKLLNEAWEDEFGWSCTKQNTKTLDGSYIRFTCLHALCGGVPGEPISFYDWDDDDCYEIATLLIEAGADVHRQTEKGETALHSIVQTSYFVSRALIDAGALADAVDARGRTPLYYSQVPACVPLLVEGGADVDARDVHGHTPLLAALAEDNNEVKILLLLQYGADAQALNPAGDGALHVALKSYYVTPVILCSLGISTCCNRRFNR